MDSIMSVCQSQLFFKDHQSSFLTKYFQPNLMSMRTLNILTKRMKISVIAMATTASEGHQMGYSGDSKGFMEEMRHVAMKLHTKDQLNEDEREPHGPPVAKWKPSVERCLQYLVDNKLVFDTIEGILDKATFPIHIEFRNTGLERSMSIAKDLEWFKQQGHNIPEASYVSVSYANYLWELSEKHVPEFLCYFYNIYFAQIAGGPIVGKKLKESLNGKELEFYKWEGDLSKITQSVRNRINKVAQGWSNEEKDRCLNETPMTFKFIEDIRTSLMF